METTRSAKGPSDSELEARQGYKLSNPISSDALPPTRLQNLPNRATSLGSSVQTHEPTGSPFLIQTTTQLSTVDAAFAAGTTHTSDTSSYVLLIMTLLYSRISP